tara:strand:+ start:320 stop:421 length:102 start_codon:yes stop_codon:yes gene_type:complete
LEESLDYGNLKESENYSLVLGSSFLVSSAIGRN